MSLSKSVSVPLEIISLQVTRIMISMMVMLRKVDVVMVMTVVGIMVLVTYCFGKSRGI